MQREVSHDVADSRNSSARESAQTTDSRLAQEPDQALSSAGGRRSGEGRSLRPPDCAQASPESADHESAHEDPVPGGTDPSQANQEMDLLQARRSQNRALQARLHRQGITPPPTAGPTGAFS